jgi:hypothetical protein
MRLAFGFVLLATLAGGGAVPKPAQELPKCGDARVRYEPFDESYSARMQFHSPVSSDAQPTAKDKTFSPHRTHWLAEPPLDMMKPGPWTARAYLGAVESAPDVELTFVDVVEGEPDMRWLNEKLVFGEVWWGRHYATDFIFDLEQRKFIDREMANFGEVAAPCR